MGLSPRRRLIVFRPRPWLCTTKMGDFADTRASASVDVELLPAAAARLSPALPAGEQLLHANLYAVCELVAGRAARASSARQYGAIYTRFCDALRDELGRPPVVGDVTADAIAAYSRALEQHGGRGGGPASPATRRVHLTMLRALLTQLGLDDEAAPWSANAITRCCGCWAIAGRNAELRALTLRAIRRPQGQRRPSPPVRQRQRRRRA
jgi:hypothetical protein